MKRILAVILCLLLLIPTAAPAESETVEKALSRVKIYLDMYPFSRQEIIDQLVYDGFSAEDAEAAADSCGADWMAMASRAAKQMISYYPDTSRKDLTSILLSSGYTQEETEYGVTSALGEETAATPEPTETPVSDKPLFITRPPAATPAPEEPAETPVPLLLSVTVQTAGIPYENLLHNRYTLAQEIFVRGDWNTVSFPGGEWTVGEDIPAGYYSVRTKDGKYASLDVISQDTYHTHNYYTIEDGGEIGKLELKDGMVLEFSRTLVFGKPRTLGF